MTGETSGETSRETSGEMAGDTSDRATALPAGTLPAGVAIHAPVPPAAAAVFSPEALAFVAQLQRAFDARRRALLAARAERQAALDAGARPDFLAETAGIRAGDWQVAPAPPDLEKRHVEITGPVDRKMIINALNSGADVYMADFEDANSPTWTNTVEGQANLIDAVAGTISFTSPDGKHYRLGEQLATLMVRPRGWHLDEKHVHVDGAPVAAALFDFGLFFFHNARALLAHGTGPYFYLPKLESHREAALWNDVFVAAQEALGIPRGTIRATVLIENVLAAFEMDEILYALREHAAGLNAGRWDYIFSIIRKFRSDPALILPDRALITMTVPFMRAYTELLVRTCHRRGAHAMGGMAAFIPSRRDPEVNAVALAKVGEDKQREAGDGFDGTWVAHPDLVPVAREHFDRALGERPHQKERLRLEVAVSPAELLDFRVAGGAISEAGLRNNISVGLLYLAAWLEGSGAVPIYNLMEDTATAEIARSQVWQWLQRPAARLTDGRAITPALYAALAAEEFARAAEARAEAAGGALALARELFDQLVLADTFVEFLTEPAYRHLE
jgi:malate synthase